MPKTESLKITTEKGHELAVRLDYAAGKHRGWAIFAHCFTCSKDVLAAARVAQELSMQGIATLRLDFTGLGQSGGDFADTSFTSNIDDITTAALWLAKHHSPPKLLVGHSLGGAAVLAATADLPSIKGVATIGAPADPNHVEHLFSNHLDDITRDGAAEVSIGGRQVRVGKGFVDDLMMHDGAAIIGSLAVDLLVLHSPVDDIVGIEHAAAIYAAAKHPKSFVSLDKADHLLTKRGDSHFAAGIISAWAARCLGEGGDITAAEDDVVEGGLIVQSSPDNPLAHDIRVGNHLMRADEPPSFPGGHDSGPAPYDFLKAGLGACTAITIRLVAERKKWPLTDCRIIVHHQIKEGDEGGDIFTRELVLEGALNEEQRQFLLGIANKCPVHKTLERGAHIETVLKV